MEVELGMVDHDTSSGSDQAEGLSVALRVSSHDMYEKHPLAASNRTGGIFLGGYKGSIAMNQGSLRVRVCVRIRPRRMLPLEALS